MMATRGQKRHLVTLENPGPSVPDGDGGYTQTWASLGSRYAEVKPATARDLERTIAGTVLSTASHIVTLDYQAGVTTATRVLFKGRTLSVTGVANPDERDVDLVLVCVEVV
jgi:SPP1 family predicted phage head-tail adaptor